MIRPAIIDDVPTIARLIRALADYERLAHRVDLDEARLRDHLFGPRPHAEVLLAEEDGQVIGFALFFHNFSTFLARPGGVPRRPVRRAGTPRSGPRQGAVGGAGPHGDRARLRPVGVVGAELERTGDRLLPRAGGGADGRVDRLPVDG